MQSTAHMNRRGSADPETAVERPPQEMEQIVVFVRLQLYNRGLPCGPAALRRSLISQYQLTGVPSERTIARILARNGLTHGRTGWYDDDQSCRCAVARSSKESADE